jgi:CHAD domain-containing protein
MPYRFKIDEPVEKGFRRIAREQLDASLAELAGPQVDPSGVHECRKALKRLRALVRLAAGAIGNGKARRRTKSLGEIAQLLSARRDQTVMLETIGKLGDEVLDAAGALAPLRADLIARSGNQPKSLDADTAARARLLLLQEAKKFSRMPFGKRGFSALQGGLETSYRRARKATKYAYDEPTDENFHNLRKAVQWHWRQMSLLARAWPDEFAVRVSAARELSQLLGDDHDLAMLVAAASGAAAMSAEQKEAAVGLCRRQQEVLRATAEFRAKRLFVETPDAFIKRVAAYWRYSRTLDPRVEAPPLGRQGNEADHGVQPAADGQIPAPEKKPAPAKPRLATKSVAPAASQRRA